MVSFRSCGLAGRRAPDRRETTDRTRHECAAIDGLDDGGNQSKRRQTLPHQTGARSASPGLVEAIQILNAHRDEVVKVMTRTATPTPIDRRVSRSRPAGMISQRLEIFDKLHGLGLGELYTQHPPHAQEAAVGDRRPVLTLAVLELVRGFAWCDLLAFFQSSSSSRLAVLPASTMRSASDRPVSPPVGE